MGVPREALSHSVGTDASSPTARHALYGIRSRLMGQQLWFEPVVKVEIWKAHIYAALWWNPVFPPLAILRPEKWHTTLLRAWPQRALGELTPFLSAWSTLLQALADMILQPQRGDGGGIAVWLVPPPWRRSWTFGVPAEVRGALEPLQTVLRELVRGRDPEAYITPEPDSHISWN